MAALPPFKRQPQPQINILKHQVRTLQSIIGGRTGTGTMGAAIVNMNGSSYGNVFAGTAAFLMTGLNLTLTPSSSGHVVFIFDMTYSGSGTPVIKLCYGTGTPPVSGAAASGTVMASISYDPTLGVTTPATVKAIATVAGLTLATAYWFDVQVEGTSVTVIATAGLVQEVV